MVGLQTLDLAIGVRVPASQPNRINELRAAHNLRSPFLCAGSASKYPSCVIEADEAPRRYLIAWAIRRTHQARAPRLGLRLEA